MVERTAHQEMSHLYNAAPSASIPGLLKYATGRPKGASLWGLKQNGSGVYICKSRLAAAFAPSRQPVLVGSVRLEGWRCLIMN
jgi:hypothetical protein